MALDFILLLIGLAFLVKFSSLTIKNAIRFSHLTGISSMTVGFIIIAVATSLPEFAIAIISSLKNEGLLSLGNIIGANISNVALIFGITSLIGFQLKRFDVVQAQKILIITTIIAIFILILRILNYVLGIFLLIVFYIFSKAIVKNRTKAKQRAKGLRIESIKSLIYLLVSIIFVVISASIVTDSAVKLADKIGIAESVIGATILAMGTTMPELSVNIAAIRKKNVGLAVGNTIGSVITNITLILGVATLINSISVGYAEIVGLVSLILINVLFFFLLARGVFRKYEGIILLAVYAVYLAVMFSVGVLLLR